MIKVKLGSVEILGYIGIVVWLAVNFLRGFSLSNNNVYIFLLGTLPNLGAAWVTTMIGKWILLFVFKKSITIKIHIYICTVIFVLALCSELIHHWFLDSPFDIYDMIMTLFAQLCIFFFPIITKDKYFSNYEEAFR